MPYIFKQRLMTDINKKATNGWLDYYRAYLFGFSLWMAMFSSMAIGILHYFRLFQYNSPPHGIACFIFSSFMAIILFLYQKNLMDRDKLIWASLFAVQTILMSNVLHSTGENVRFLWFSVALIPAQFLGGSRMGLPVFISSILFIIGYYLNTNYFNETDVLSSISILSICYFFLFYLLRLLQEADSEITSHQSELEGMVIHDGLTSLFNRRYFDQIFSHEWQRGIRERLEISLLMIDIDDFKQFNDKYGHLAGDELLRSVSMVMRKTMSRSTDKLFRYGGEEFVVILPGTNHDGALVVAERLRKSVSSGIDISKSGFDGTITVSIGVATMLPASDSLQDELIRLADKNLYTAKKNGKNRIV